MTRTPNALPDGWAVVPLQEVAEVAFSGVDKKTVDGEVPVSLCNYTDVFYNRRINGRLDFMSATATPAEIERWSLRKGDVLFTKDSETPDEIGVPAYVEEDLPGVLCGYHLGRARPLPGRVDGAFLAASLHTSRARQHFARIANGVTRFGLTLGATRSFPVPLPPMSEQRRIATMLDSVDHTINETSALMSAVERLREGLRHELLTNGLPNSERERERERPVASRDEPRCRRTIGANPRSWRIRRLGDLCHPPQYGAPAPARPFDPSLPRYVRITDITADGRLRLGGARSADPSLVTGYELRDGDLLFARSGSVGRTFLYCDSDGACVFAGYFIRFRVRAKSVSSRFLAVWTHSHFYRRWVASMLRTGAQPNINATEYASLRVPVPPLLEQRAIVGVMDRLDATLRQARAMRRALMSFRAAFSSHLFRRGTSHVLRPRQ